MEWRKKIIQPRGADKIFIKAYKGARVGISEVEIKVYDFICRNAKFIRDKFDQPSIMFAENLTFFLNLNF